MRLSIQHETFYRYDAPVRASTQCIRLTPRETARHTVVQWDLDTPRPATQTHDGYGNVLHVLTLDKPVREIRIRAHGVVESGEAPREAADPVWSGLSPLVFLRPTAITRVDEAIARFAEPFRRRSGVLTALRELAGEIVARMPLNDSNDESHSAAQAFAAGRISARDQAHLFIACCRHVGVPARYVSGYVMSNLKDTPRITGHAWTEAWITDRWRSFDLVESAAPGTEHLKLAVGADYLDACPIRGIRLGGGIETMEAQAKVQVAQ